MVHCVSVSSEFSSLHVGRLIALVSYYQKKTVAVPEIPELQVIN